ncbi:hypothetical protein [Chryseobacterium caseinilyticum]|uniref:Uncharacterized protein n=1 Tax=Chryseobacterium caseinilyticum TaxID=2771428 RepID=A0ABR8Z7C1_9FLAO|nr:hypothetical protein [Chryseobacterium caseinilyticum]MBD8081135.1 hypothetical protein [Chryseobacterium caseinilyticum]
MRKNNAHTGDSEKEVIQTLQELLISNSPEGLEDMIFHVFEDANLCSGDLSADEKSLRHEFHLSIRKILRILNKDPQLLKKFKDG